MPTEAQWARWSATAAMATALAHDQLARTARRVIEWDDWPTKAERAAYQEGIRTLVYTYTSKALEDIGELTGDQVQAIGDEAAAKVNGGGPQGISVAEVELPEPAPDEPPPNWREGLISEDWDERMTALMLEYLHHERDTQGNGFELMTHMSEIRSVLMRFNEGNGDIYHLRYAAEQLVAFLMLDIEGHLAVKRSERHLALRRARKRDENAAED